VICDLVIEHDRIKESLTEPDLLLRWHRH